MALHANLESFMGELKSLPKGSAERGKFITQNMSHPPFVSAVQKHPQGKQLHAQLMGFLNSPSNAGPQKAQMTAKAEPASNSLHPTVVEYGVREMMKGKNPESAAMATVKKLNGAPNMFLGSPTEPVNIDHQELSLALNRRLVDHVIGGLSKVKSGKEHFALDGTVQHFNQKPQVRERIKQGVVAKLGADPFSNDDFVAPAPGKTVAKNEGNTFMADKELYSVDEAAGILRKDFQEKLAKYSAEIENLMAKENLAKSSIPSHKHIPAATTSSGTEDIAAGQANPKGTAKAEDCMKCGEMHEKMKKCGPVTKSDLVDSKSKRSDNHTDPESGKMPDGKPAEPSKRADSSGGQMTKSGGPIEMAKRAMAMNKGEEKKQAPKSDKKPKRSATYRSQSELIAGYKQHLDRQIANRQSASNEPDEKMNKANPPMAKPPSGGTPGGSKTPPMSKPASPKAPMMKEESSAAPKKIQIGNDPKPTYTEKAKSKPQSKVVPSGMEKAGLGIAAHGQREAASMGFGAPPAAPAPDVKLPGAKSQAVRAAGFHDQMSDAVTANKPAATGPVGSKLGLNSPKAAGVTPKAGPVVNMARPVASRPGIFGKLFGSK